MCGPYFVRPSFDIIAVLVAMKMPLHAAISPIRKLAATLGAWPAASCVGAAALVAPLVGALLTALLAALLAVPARPQTPAATTPAAAAGAAGIEAPAVAPAPHVAPAGARPGETAAPMIGSDCAGGVGISGTAASVIDGRTFLFTDGREMRLAAIETPPLASPDTAREDAGIAAKAALEALVLHRPVVVRPAGAAPDRYGRLIVYAIAAAPETFVQREMLAQGYALQSPAAAAPGCRSLLRAAERSARAAKLGLWGNPYYEVKQADNPADVLAGRGRFAVVAGLVASVRESGGIVYVNFGRRWSEDFTVTILKRNERLFAGAGLAPSKLAGRRIEVRGWIEERGGPAIEAARPEQIELVETARKAK
jgi:endonuclease YncB( thermonuclease family)